MTVPLKAIVVSALKDYVLNKYHIGVVTNNLSHMTDTAIKTIHEQDEKDELDAVSTSKDSSKTQKVVTNSEQETYNFALGFAKTIKGGTVIALSGDLGAGKTIFTKGLARGLGYQKTVNSPTFVIMKLYDMITSKIKNLCHIDAYRLSTSAEIKAIGADEYFRRADTVTVIEWPENIKNILPKKTINIKIVNNSETSRVITIK